MSSKVQQEKINNLINNENQERLEIYKKVMEATQDLWSDDEGYKDYDYEGLPIDQIPIEHRPQIYQLDLKKDEIINNNK